MFRSYLSRLTSSLVLLLGLAAAPAQADETIRIEELIGQSEFLLSENWNEHIEKTGINQDIRVHPLRFTQLPAPEGTVSVSVVSTGSGNPEVRLLRATRTVFSETDSCVSRSINASGTTCNSVERIAGPWGSSASISDFAEPEPNRSSGPDIEERKEYSYDFRTTTGDWGADDTFQIVFEKQDGRSETVTIELATISQDQASRIDDDQGEFFTTRTNFSSHFEVTASTDGVAYFGSWEDGGALPERRVPEIRVRREVQGDRICLREYNYGWGLPPQCVQWGYETSIEQVRGFSSEPAEILAGDIINVRAPFPAEEGDPSTTLIFKYPVTGYDGGFGIKRTLSYPADTFSAGFRENFKNFDLGIIFHDEDPDEEMISILRESSIEVSKTIVGLLESETSYPVYIEVPNKITLSVNGSEVPPSLSGSTNRAEVKNGDVVTLRVSGARTELFNADNTLGDGTHPCTAAMTIRDAVACQRIRIYFHSANLTEMSLWQIGRAEVETSPMEMKEVAISIPEFSPSTGVFRGSPVQSNSVEISTDTESTAEVSATLRILSGQEFVSLPRTSLVINGKDTGKRSVNFSVPGGGSANLAIKTEIFPDLTDPNPGTAVLQLEIGGKTQNWSVSWTGQSLDLAGIVNALNGIESGLGDRLSRIVAASVSEYGLNSGSNIYIDKLQVTPVSRIAQYLQSNPDMEVMTPRGVTSLSEATQDSRRAYGEARETTPMAFEGLFFEDILNAPISTLTETSQSALLTPSVAGVNPSTMMPYNIGDSVPISIIEQQGNPQFRTAPTCDVLPSGTWENFNAGSTMQVGACIQLRMTSSDFFNTIRSVRFTAGSANAVWRVRTMTVPLEITDYPPAEDVEWGALTEASEARVIESSDNAPFPPVLVTPVGDGSPEMCIVPDALTACPEGGWTTGAQIYKDGEAIRIRAMSPNTPAGGTHTARIVVGDTGAPTPPSADFVITTTAGGPPVIESEIGAGEFVDLMNQPVSFDTKSNRITVRQNGTDPAGYWFAEVVGPAGSNPLMKVNTGPEQNGIVQIFPDDTISLSQRTSPNENEAQTLSLKFYFTSTEDADVILQRDWTATTGVGIQECYVSGEVETRDYNIILGRDAAEHKQGPGILEQMPGIIPGDVVTINAIEVGELEDWVAAFPEDPAIGAHSSSSMTIPGIPMLWDPGWNDRGHFDDLTCDQAEGNTVLVELAEAHEYYNSWCCTGPEFATHGYPYGRGIHDPVQTPLEYELTGGENESSNAGMISYSAAEDYLAGRPASNYGWMRRNSAQLVANEFNPALRLYGNPVNVSIAANKMNLGVPVYGGVAGDDYTAMGYFPVQPGSDAFLLVNGVPSGTAAMVGPTDKVEVGLSVSEGMYQYAVLMRANGYAVRRVLVDVAKRTPRGIIEPRGQDFGTFTVPAGGEISFPEIFTMPSVMSDPDAFYPDAITSVRGSFDMKGPTMLAYVPLNEYAEALLRGNAYEAPVPSGTSAIGSAQSGDGGNIGYYDQVFSHETANLTVMTPHGNHGNTTGTSPAIADGPANRRFFAESGDTFGVRIREAAQIKGPARFGVYLPHYSPLPSGIPDFFRKGIAIPKQFERFPDFVNIDVANGMDLTVYGAQPQSWQNELLGTFTLAPDPGDDPQPDTTYVNTTDRLTGMMVYSEARTWTGFSGEVPVYVTGSESSEMQIDDGEWVTEGEITSGSTIRLRHVTADTAGETTITELNVGRAQVNWSNATVATPLSCSPNYIHSGNWGTWKGDTLSIHIAGNVPQGSDVIAYEPDFTRPESAPWANINDYTGADDLCGISGPVELEIISSRGITNPGLEVDTGGSGETVDYAPGDELFLTGRFDGDWSIEFATTDRQFTYSMAMETRNMDDLGLPIPASGLSPVDFGPTQNIRTAFDAQSANIEIPELSVEVSNWYPASITPVTTALPEEIDEAVNVYPTLLSGTPAETAELTEASVVPGSGDAFTLDLSMPRSGSGSMTYGIRLDHPTNGVLLPGEFVVNFDPSFSGGDMPPTEFEDATFRRYSYQYSNEIYIDSLPGGGPCGTISRIEAQNTPHNNRTYMYRDNKSIRVGDEICIGEFVRLRAMHYGEVPDAYVQVGIDGSDWKRWNNEVTRN